MHDPWWPGEAPQAREATPAAPATVADDTPAATGLPGVLVPVLALAWLAAGPWFGHHADHFGPGFAPMLVWMFTYPVVAIVQIVAAIAQLHRYRDGRFGSRFRAWRLTVWALAAVGYITLPIAAFLQ